MVLLYICIIYHIYNICFITFIQCQRVNHAIYMYVNLYYKISLINQWFFFSGAFCQKFNTFYVDNFYAYLVLYYNVFSWHVVCLIYRFTK